MMRILIALSFYIFLPLAVLSFIAHLVWLMILIGWDEADGFLEKEHLKRTQSKDQIITKEDPAK